MRPKQYLAIALALAGGLFGLYIIANALTWVDAGEIVVIQSPISGDLTVISEPGPTWQGWGKVTSYPRRQQIIFKRVERNDNSIQVRFNDGGHANVSGIVSWEMPLAAEAVIRLHKEFTSIEAIDLQLVQPAIIKAFYLTSPLMSSTESYASRRTEFLQLFEDQLRNGVYKTRTVSVKEPDPVTGVEKTVSKVELVMDDKDQPARAESSAFAIYKISILPATITALDYDPEVERQITQQRDAVLAVQAAQANAKKAEQDAITAKSNGEAQSAIARAQQEAIKAAEVTQAEKQRDVATLNAQQARDVAKLAAEAAEFTKRQNILLGEGEAERKRLVMSADGALEQKLAAYIRVNEMYATAIGQHQGSWVPSVIMGNNAGSAANGGAQQLMEMFSVKAARDLALDFNLNSSASRTPIASARSPR